MSGVMPAYILRELDNSGKLLSGGKVYTYESGTLTPKTTYTDYTLTIPQTNPVVLDAGGAADIWLGDGAYRLLVTDANGVQIRSPIDGIVGVGSGSIDAASNITPAFLGTYNDLRALISVPDTVYVSGRSIPGDGGEGQFQLQPTSVEVDDDGIILVTAAGTHVYRRVFDGVLDPRWYGVTYGSAIDQVANLTHALASSALYNFPVLSAGPTFLGQDLVIPAGATYKTTQDGYLYASADVTVTVQTGAKIDSDSVIFGVHVNPILGASVAPQLRLSWFGGSDPWDRWAKLAASTSATYSVMVDVSTSVGADPACPANFALDFSGGATINLDGAVDITLGCVAYTGKQQIISWTDPAQISAVSIGAPEIYPEWFGAVGDGTTDDSYAVYAAAKTGGVDLGAKTYLLGPLWSTLTTPTPLEIRGGTLALDDTATLGTGVLALNETTITKTTSDNWFEGSALVAVNSEIPPDYIATAKSLSGCKITGLALAPVYDGAPLIGNGYLDILSAPFLGTDADGKIQDVGRNVELTNIGYSRAAAGGAIITTTRTLTNPLPLVQIVANIGGSSIVITLPNMAGLTYKEAPNLFMLVTTGSATYTVVAQGAIWSTTHNGPMWLYCDMNTNSWYALKGSA